MINFKQMELSQQLFQNLKIKFPELQLINIVESPVDSDSVWVRVSMPKNDDKEFDVFELSGELSTDILLNDGYHILISIISKESIGCVIN